MRRRRSFRDLLAIFAALLALGCADTTHAQAAAPSQPATVEPKTPEGVDPKLTSADPEYGYSKKNPIKVGPKDGLTGPGAEVAYFNTLRDEAGKPITFARLGSFGAGPDGDYLDGYEVRTSTNRKVVLYIDMYHPKSDPKKQLAPKGFFKAQGAQRLTVDHANDHRRVAYDLNKRVVTSD